MDIQTILTQVDTVWVPNTISYDVKVALLNTFQNELYRKVRYPNTEYTTYLFADVDTYTLPTACKPDRIKTVRFRENRRIATSEAITAWYEVAVPPAPSELDLNGDDTINLSETILLATGRVYVLNKGDETEYEFDDSLSLNDPAGYAYTIYNDTSIRLAPTPEHNGGTVASASVSDGGSGYTSAPTVTFSAPTTGSTATGTATVSGGAVTGITITNAGAGYQYPPRITFSGGGGTGATADSTIYTDTLVIDYAPVPTALVVTDLTVSPWGPSDYHQYYVWKLAEMMAKAGLDAARANGFAMDAAEVLANMKTDYSSKSESSFQMNLNW